MRELGDLWDVPILFLDSLQDSEVTPLVGAMCMSPPSWLSHTGADVLLTTGFWGGLNGRGQVGQDLPGPRPRTNIDLGLLPEAKRQCCDVALAIQAASAEVGFTSSTDKMIKGNS